MRIRRDGILETQPVSISTTVPVSVTGTAAVTQSGTWNVNVSAAALPLPSGAATSANQSTIITSLQLIDNAVNTHSLTASTDGLIVMGVNPTGLAKQLNTAPDGDLIVHQHSEVFALADAVSNSMQIPVNDTDNGFLATPNTNYQFNGTTWDRVRGDATNGLLVNLGSNNDVTISQTLSVAGTVAITGTVAVTGTFWQTTQPVSVTGTAAVSIAKVGQTTAADSFPVVLASNQSAIPVTQSGTWNVNLTTTASISVGNTVTVSGTVTLTGTSAVSIAKVGQTTAANSFPVVLASDQSAIPVTQSGTWNVNLTSTASINVNLTTTSTINVNQSSDIFIKATASSVTLFQSTIAVQTFLVANLSRSGAYFYNDGNQTCYIKLGSQASAGSYTVKLTQDSFYELPAGKSIYTGIITGTFIGSTTTGVMVTEIS